MKKKYFLLAFFSFIMVSANAQWGNTDDLEIWTVGTPIFGDHPANGADWTSWSGTVTDAGWATSNQARSGVVSYYIDGAGVMNGVLELGNLIFGVYYLQFWAYVPSGKSAYYNVQAVVPVIPSWCGEFYFNRENTNPGSGEAVGFNSFTFSFPHDEWFLVQMDWDIAAGLAFARWGMRVDGSIAVPYNTPYVDSNGDTPAALGGLNFSSVHESSEFYIDDLLFADNAIGIEDFEAKGFSTTPNPVKDVLTLNAKEDITSVSIYNILGQRMFSSEINSLTTQIDMSTYEAGIYVVKAVVGNSEGTMKIIVE